MIDRQKIEQKAISYYGRIQQHTVAMEELGELIQAISKYLRKINKFDTEKERRQIVEEIADVYIMLDQLKIMHNVKESEIEQEIEYKLVRLNGRISIK